MTHREFEKFHSKKLLPCPFCGSKAIVVQWRDTLKPNATWIECTRPACGIQTRTVYHKLVEGAVKLAIKLWNRRPTK